MASDQGEAFPTVPPPPGLERPWRHLHPAAMAIWPLAQVGPLLVLLVLGAFPAPLLGFLLALSGVSSVIRWERFRWRVDADSLVIEQGVLQRQRRVIPLDRVQTVDIVRRLRHRPFGVVEVRVEAIGGGSTEGQLDALSTGDAAALRSQLLHEADPGAIADRDAIPQGTVLVRMTPGRLVLAGLTGGRVGVAAALLGFAQQVFGDRVDELIQRLPALVSGLRAAVLLVIVILLGAFLLSIVVTVFAYWGFTLTHDGDVLRIRRGLLEQRLDTLPLRRVQSVRVEENFLRRLLGMAAVKVDVAGRAGSDEGRDTGILLPLGSRQQAFELVAAVLDHEEIPHVQLHPMPTGARARRLVRAAWFTAAVGVIATVLAGLPGLLALALGLPAGAAALDAYRSLGHARVGDVVIARSGVLVRRTVFVGVPKLQAVALTSNPFQRQRHLGSLELRIARSPGVWGGPELVDLDIGDGRRLLAGLAAESDRHGPAPQAAGFSA